MHREAKSRMDSSEMGRKGGKARAKKLTPAQRREIGRKGGKARALKAAEAKNGKRKP
jgi:general stress protein YciG